MINNIDIFRNSFIEVPINLRGYNNFHKILLKLYQILN